MRKTVLYEIMFQEGSTILTRIFYMNLYGEEGAVSPDLHVQNVLSCQIVELEDESSHHSCHGEKTLS